MYTENFDFNSSNRFLKLRCVAQQFGSENKINAPIQAANLNEVQVNVNTIEANLDKDDHFEL